MINFEKEISFAQFRKINQNYSLKIISRKTKPLRKCSK